MRRGRSGGGPIRLKSLATVGMKRGGTRSVAGILF